MSTRNFDHRVVIERQRALQTAQGLYRATVAGKTIVANPQNSSSSPQTIVQFQEGYQTAYYKGLVGGTSNLVASPGGIQNILIEQQQASS